MILSRQEITRAVHSGDIVIEPFDETRLNPNSYDFCLGTTYRTYESAELDAREPEAPMLQAAMPADGLLLDPGRIYLIDTAETIGSRLYVPIIRGRSSTGRMGVFIHITADMMELGQVGPVTLQLHAVMPVRVYPGLPIGQVTFWAVQG